jgi:pimeloyl-ACP methyl ester carboxylesterase
VAGNDFGNRVARILAAFYPELKRTVILLAVRGRFSPNERPSTRWKLSPTRRRPMPRFWRSFHIWCPTRQIRPASGRSSSLRWLPAAGGGEEATAEARPLKARWAPPGQTGYLILQGAADQIAPSGNGLSLQKELGDQARLVNVPGAAHFLPLNQPETTASHVTSFIRQLGGTSHQVQGGRRFPAVSKIRKPGDIEPLK